VDTFLEGARSSWLSVEAGQAQSVKPDSSFGADAESCTKRGPREIC
jgi:hypothetical protein